MGGTVAVTLRMENGEEYRMHRWTNSLPWFAQNSRFFEKDSKHIEEYLSQWKEMKADWEKNADSGKFDFAMTPVYEPYPAPLAPVDYGLVVFDFMKNVVLSCQKYTSLDRVYLCRGAQYESEKYEETLGLFRAGRIDRMVSYTEEGMVVLPNCDTEKEFHKFATTKSKEDKHELLYLMLKTDPFRVEIFEESPEGFAAMKQNVLDLGFKLSDTDEEAWDRFTEEREDD